ncbi:MAG TPA: DUF4383 domain-containing protein [Solirubrobacterales bacterium]|nr:DUF4383 domain-containing protein [Solirubrobacterales bacterium]
MEVASPARLYTAAAGVLLLLLGIVGFFYSASFGAPGAVEEALGTFRVNAWSNLLYLVSGALGLLAAGVSSRRYALAAGTLFTILAVWGFAIDAGQAVLGFLPAGGADNTLRLAVGLLGLAAAAATPRSESRGSFRTRDVHKEPRDSESRAQAAG